MENKFLPLRKRPEFLAVRSGEKRRGALFLLEMKQRSAEAEAKLGNSACAAPRLGLTVSRKNGNAVCRNRIKRRLRAAVLAAEAANLADPHTDYVLIARPEILTAPFARLAAELRRRFGAPKGGRPKSDKV